MLSPNYNANNTIPKNNQAPENYRVVDRVVVRRHSLAPSNVANNVAKFQQQQKMQLSRNKSQYNFSNSARDPTSQLYHAQCSPMLEIDRKIEQAMDLVKTHLMFAVREEMEVLRARILELETTIIHLEAENSILKEHIAPELLENLVLAPTPKVSIAH